MDKFLSSGDPETLPKVLRTWQLPAGVKAAFRFVAT